MKYFEEQEHGFYGYTFFTGGIESARGYARYNGSIGVVIEADLSEEALLPDDNDCPSCKTWEDSLKRIDQVKVLGEITSDHIRRIHFFDNQTKKKIFVSTWDNWEEDMKKNKSKFSNPENVEYDSNIHEDYALLLKKAQELGLNIQNNVIINPPVESISETYRQVTDIKGKQESLRGYFGDDGNVYVTYHSIVNVEQGVGNFVYIGEYLNTTIWYVNFNSLLELIRANSVFVDNLRTVFGDNEFSIQTNKYTIDKLVDMAQSRTASVKRLIKRKG
jgi:hypothetical protein